MTPTTSTLLTLLIFFGALLPKTAAADEIYRYTDKDGSVTYTDAPPLNASAERVKIKITNVQSAPSSRDPEDEQTSNAGEEEPPEERPYTTARIVQPSYNAVIPPGQLDVVVQLKLEPQLQSGHRVQLYFDNKKQGAPAAATTFSLTNLSRGEHQIRAEVIGPDNRRRTRTQNVVIHVKRASSNR